MSAGPGGVCMSQFKNWRIPFASESFSRCQTRTVRPSGRAVFVWQRAQAGFEASQKYNRRAPRRPKALPFLIP